MKKEAGLTLFEIIIVIIVILIISATSLPIISRTLIVFRVKTGAETIGTRLNQARQESVRRGASTYVFFDPANSRIFVDLNHNGIPEGSGNADVAAKRILNEEYNLPNGVLLSVRSSTSTCFGLTDALIALKPPEISSYTGWKHIYFDSRGELEINYRAAFNACIVVNLNPAQSDPTGAVLTYCTQGNSGATRYTISTSLRGNASVLTYKRLP